MVSSRGFKTPIRQFYLNEEVIHKCNTMASLYYSLNRQNIRICDAVVPIYVIHYLEFHQRRFTQVPLDKQNCRIIVVC